MMPSSWADQLLPQLLMEQFDTLPIQCRRIEHMHEGVWFRKIIFAKISAVNICMKEFGSENIIFDKMTAVRT